MSLVLTSTWKVLGVYFSIKSGRLKAGEKSTQEASSAFGITLFETTLFNIAFVYGKTRYRKRAAKKPRLVVVTGCPMTTGRLRRHRPPRLLEGH